MLKRERIHRDLLLLEELGVLLSSFLEMENVPDGLLHLYKKKLALLKNDMDAEQQEDESVEHMAVVEQVRGVDLPIKDVVESECVPEYPRLKEEAKYSLNEQLSQASETSLGDSFGEKKIVSLIQEIGLNDRFFFVAELFDNSMDKYLSTINHLDSLDSYGEAKHFLSDRYNWDTDNPAYVKFDKIVYRRY